MEAKDIITLVIAGYAAVLSTVVAIHAIAKGRRDRGQFKTVITLSERIPKQLVMHITITNIGKRPASLDRILVKYKQANTPGIFDLEPPKRLEEAESNTWHLPITSRSTGWLPKTKSVYALNATGKRWRMGRKELREFTSQAVELLRVKQGG